MSAPHAAGAAALVKVMNPGAKPLDVRNYLRSSGITSGTDYFTDDPDIIYEVIHELFCEQTPPQEPLLNVSSCCL